MRKFQLALLAAVGTGAMTTMAPVSAQSTDTDAQITAIETQIKLLEAKADLAQAKVDRAAVFLDQLPEFDGKVTPGSDTGKFESTVLAAAALGVVTDKIGALIADENVLILTGSEQFQFGLPSALNAEMRVLKHAFPLPPESVADCPATAEIAPAMVAAAISTFAGLIRSDVTMTSINANAIDANMLVNSLAAKLNRKGQTAYILSGSPGSKLLAKDACGFDDMDKWIDSKNLGTKYVWLLLARHKAKSRLTALNSIKPTTTKVKAEIKAVTGWVEQFDMFNATVSATQKTGPSTLAAAIQASELEDDLKAIVRVDVEMAGGSLKNSKNIGTFFGVDPLRVTGGLIASYTIFTISDSGRTKPSAWGMWACSSDQMRLGKVRLAKFSPEGKISKTNPNVCWQVQAFPTPKPGT